MSVNAGGSVVQRNEFSIQATGVPVAYGIPANMPPLSRTYTTGTGAGMIDGVHYKSYSLAATPTTLDLTALQDPNGQALTVARVRELVVKNNSAYPLIIGNAAATQWSGFLSSTGTLTVPPYGSVQLADYSTVGTSQGAYVDSTHKSLKFDPGANTVAFDLFLATCSAQS